MLAWLLVAHAVAAVGAPWLVRAVGARVGFSVLALVPGAVTGALAVLALEGLPREEGVAWISAIEAELALRLDTLAAVMALVVAGVGAVVLLYCSHYFGDASGAEAGQHGVDADLPAVAAFAGQLTAFAGAMLGLVLADDLLLLYIFWELTTVLSYLLIGFHHGAAASRVAAKQALLVTTAGGLAMLVGIVLLGEAAGTYRLSGLVATAPSALAAGDAAVTAGVLLLLAGALTKSALVPFHFWLPAAMAAPTPVSAYLHAAAMVKAGVYLVARLAPVYAALPAWRWTVLAVGAATMLIGGWRALRQHDLKLLLAYGTVSQLGMLVLLLGWGTRGLAVAGLTLLVSHALFKAALFLVVGALERATGSRDLRELTGVARRAPWLSVGAVLAGVSMAGLPPLVGFVGKEAAMSGLLVAVGLDPFQPEVREPLALVAATAFLLGSVLTVAYTGRFLIGALGPAWSQDARWAPPEWRRPGALLVGVPLVLALSGLALGPAAGFLEPGLAGYARELPADPVATHLALWHGLTPALGLSALVWMLGGLLVVGRQGVERLQARVALPPSLAASHAYHQVVRGVDRLALEATGSTARGSLPALLATILLVLVILVGGQLLRGVTWPDQWLWWESPAQAAVAALVTVAAVFAARARRRLRAVFLVGVTGYGAALLFLLHGAPDLALTQVLVETVAIVVLVLVLRRMSGRFPDDPSRGTRRLRVLLGSAVAAVLVGATATAAAVRRWQPAGVGLEESAPGFGGGNNIVNVILVDARAWDTMGELSVVLAAATGVASLVFLREDVVDRVRRQLRDSWRYRSAPPEPADPEHRRWLAAAAELDPRRRSTIFEVVTRVVFHTIVVWSLYLLFSGHNAPGGGFAAGLVCGLALTVRYLAGRGQELRMAAPVMPGLLLGAGLFIAAGSAFLPMAAGYSPLQTFILDLEIPLLGQVHLVTSLLFDVGVYLVVIGLMLDLLRSLGSALDDQIAQEARR